MKIVLDTNVFISGIFFSGPPSQILEAWKNRRLKIVLSQQILSEYQRVAEELAETYPTLADDERLKRNGYTLKKRSWLTYQI